MRWMIAASALALSLTACKVEAPSQTSADQAVKELSVTDRGYEPSRIDVLGGQPVVLRVTRNSRDTCGEVLVIQGVRHVLPFGRTIEVRVTPPLSGELAFSCGMGMMHGTLVAR